VTRLAGTLLEQGTDAPVEGASVRAYRTVLRLTRSLSAYAGPGTGTAAVGRLDAGDRPVLEVRRGPEKGSDFVLVSADGLPGGQGWVCSRWRITHYALLHDEPLPTTGPPTGADGRFVVEAEVEAPVGQLYRLRAVHQGHRDTDGPRAAAQVDVPMAAEPLAGPVAEARLVDLLHYFEGWFYSPMKDPNNSDAGRYVSQYPYDIGISIRLDKPHPPRTTYDDCCTFVEALLVRAWRDAGIANFTWGKADHEKAIIGQGRDRFDSVRVLEEKGMAEPIDADELPPPWTAVQTWHTVQVVNKKTKQRQDVPRGHTLLVVDVHPDTGRLLTLESNMAFGLNGPGFRSVGGVDAFLGRYFRCPTDGHVYDPAVGDPQHGVAAGTPFLEAKGPWWPTPPAVPAGWVCPVDGTSKAEFLPHCRPPRDWWASTRIPTWAQFTAAYPERRMARLTVWDQRWLR
jgi:rubredoxin